jgi:hypothetical protein
MLAPGQVIAGANSALRTDLQLKYGKGDQMSGRSWVFPSNLHNQFLWTSITEKCNE